MKPHRTGRHWAAAVVAMVMAGCASLQSETELRAARFERAVVPMARAALAAGQVETARRLYSRLLEVAPDAVNARMGLGDVALAAGRPARAATWYLDAAASAQTRSTRHAAWLGHGRASVASGDLEAARASFGRLADVGEGAVPELAAWGHNGLAVVAMLEGDPRGAVAAVERAVLLAPDEQRLRDNLDRALAIAAAYGRAVDTPGAQGDLPMPVPPEPPVLAGEGAEAQPDAGPSRPPGVAGVIAASGVRPEPAIHALVPATTAGAEPEGNPTGLSAARSQAEPGPDTVAATSEEAPTVVAVSSAEADAMSSPREEETAAEMPNDAVPSAPIEVGTGSPTAAPEGGLRTGDGTPSASPDTLLAAHADDVAALPRADARRSTARSTNSNQDREGPVEPVPAGALAGITTAVTERAREAGTPSGSPSLPMSVQAVDMSAEPVARDEASAPLVAMANVHDPAVGPRSAPLRVAGAPTDSADPPTGSVPALENLAGESDQPPATESSAGEEPVADGTKADEPALIRLGVEETVTPPEEASAEAAALPEFPNGPREGKPLPVGFVVRRDDGRYLQVGAFAVEANARRLADRLPGLTDLPVGIDSSGDDGLHRVRIGPLASGAELSALRRALDDTPAV